MKYSVVMPIYRDEKYLPLSLPTVYNLKPDEVLLLFDTTEEIALAKKIAKHRGYTRKTRFIDISNTRSADWQCRIAFARRHGFKIAENEVILNTDADTLLDTRIKRYIEKVGSEKIGLISFNRINYPIRPRGMISTLIQRTLPLGFTGIYFLYRPYWIETEDLEDLKQIASAEDTHLHLSMKRKYKTIFINDTKNYHLRMVETRERQFLTGKLKHSVEHASLWKVTAHSILHFRPAVLAGYLKESLNPKR